MWHDKKIKIFLLSEPFGNTACFVPFYSTISFKFGFVHPFTISRILARRKGANRPSVIAFQGFQLSQHSITPNLKFNNLGKRLGFDVWVKGQGKGAKWLRKFVIAEKGKDRIHNTTRWSGWQIIVIVRQIGRFLSRHCGAWDKGRIRWRWSWWGGWKIRDGGIKGEDWDGEGMWVRMTRSWNKSK